jgi:hypothetical protein
MWHRNSIGLGLVHIDGLGNRKGPPALHLTEPSQFVAPLVSSLHMLY